MKIFEILKEHPTIVGDEDWDLSKTDDNESLKRKLLIGGGLGVEKLFDFRGINVYRYRNQFFGVDTSLSSKQLVYWVKANKHKEVCLNNIFSITQRTLWRANIAKVSGLPAKIFFEYLLKETGIISTDCVQTDAGRRFWNLRIVDAFAKELNVYVLNETEKRLIKILDENEFDSLVGKGQVWRASQTGKQIRILISEKLLVPSKGITLED